MRTVTILTAIVVALLAVAPLWAAPPQHPISKPQAYTAVSYTHLTLPTKLIV